MDKDTLLQRYRNGLGSTGKNQKLYLRYAQDFLDYGNGSFERQTIEKYLERLRRTTYPHGDNRQKYSDGTINFRFRIIRSVFNRSAALLIQEGVEWPFRRGETPQIREKNVRFLALNPKTIQRMILAIKETGGVDEQAFLSLSTTYGLRRIEMITLDPRDIKLKDRVIHITTAKHGRERSHLIPEEIIPYLSAYDFSQVVSEFGLLCLWYRMESRIALAHIDGVGFHSIRRTLNTLLGKELPDVTVKSFLRHKQRTSSDMTYRYSAVTFVGEEEDVTELVSSDASADSDVFSKHPFLKYWR